MSPDTGDVFWVSAGMLISVGAAAELAELPLMVNAGELACMAFVTVPLGIVVVRLPAVVVTFPVKAGNCAA
jgi:hypothetical protein